MTITSFIPNNSILFSFKHQMSFSRVIRMQNCFLTVTVMKKTGFTVLVLLFVSLCASGQMLIPKAYFDKIARADSLYQSKKFLSSALSYSEAFKENKNMGLLKDLYKSARSWAQAGFPDSAFAKLHKLAGVAGFLDAEALSSNPDFVNLYTDQRWGALLGEVKSRKQEALRPDPYPDIRKSLEAVFDRDQEARKHADKADEANLQLIKKTDEQHRVYVDSLLTKHGWLSKGEIGTKAASALFLVIQHSELFYQQKYLPLLTEAVKSRKAEAQDLALLEDRVSLQTTGEQIYGSQIGRDTVTKKFFLYPIKDRENVNLRRKSMNLPPLSEYLKQWNLADK